MIHLDDIVGQDTAVGQLRRAYESGRWPHALLFAGPEGVGRRTTALALAELLLCERPEGGAAGPSLFGGEVEPIPPTACGECEDCRMTAGGSHPDLHVVRKELAAYHDDTNVRNRRMQNLGIDVIRQFLIRPAGAAPSRGRGKVFVVLEADLLTDGAQNALLKTLEEPPSGATIILICRQVEQLLPTTRSRSALVRFAPLPREFVAERLAEAGVPPGEAEYWAALTGGSLGRSLAAHERGLYEGKRDLLARVANAAEDEELSERLEKAMDKLSRKLVSESRGGDAPQLAVSVANRRAAGMLLEIVSGAFRDAMSDRAGRAGPPINADQPEVVDRLAGRFDARELAGAIEQLCRYEQLLWRNVSTKTLWENVAVTCASAAALRV